MEEKLKIGIIGAGMITQKVHLPEYSQRKDTIVTVLCDTNLDRAKKLAKEYNVERVCSDWREVIEIDELDAISVCTPANLHSEMVCGAAEKGKHVLCEKPMASTLEEADLMIGTAEKHSVTLMIGLNQRFIPAHRTAKSIIESNMLGQINSIRAAFGHAGPELWTPSYQWFFDGQTSGGGVLMDLGTHKIDLVKWLMSKDVVKVTALTRTRERHIPVEDNATSLLEFADGATAVIEVSWTTKPYVENSVLAYCEQGVLRIGMERDEKRTLVVYTSSPQNGEIIYDVPPFAMPGEFNSGVIDHFVESIKSNKRPLVTGKEGREVLAIVLAAYESAASGKIVRIK